MTIRRKLADSLQPTARSYDGKQACPSQQSIHDRNRRVHESYPLELHLDRHSSKIDKCVVRSVDAGIHVSDLDHRDRRPLLRLRQTSSTGEVQVELPGGSAADVFDVELESLFRSLDSTSLQ